MVSRAAYNDVTGSPGEIPLISVVGQEPSISTLTTVWRHANLYPITVGVFNARSIHNKHTSVAQWIANRRLRVGNANPEGIFQTRVYGFDGLQTRVPGYPGLMYRPMI